MKLNVTANLQFGPGRTFMKGIYEGDNIPKELIAELKSGSQHISEVDVPNIKKASAASIAKKKRAVAAAAKKKAADKKAENKKAAAAKQKAAGEKEATEKKAAGEK